MLASGMIGTVLSNRYRIDEQLGEGGFGAVYRGTQRGLERPVAIKVLRDELCSDRDSIERFLREAEAIAKLKHPNIVHVIDVSVGGTEAPYLVMELLEGRSLARVLTEEHRLSVPRAVRMARQILAALGVAHGAGVVHRDIKPPNVFLSADHEGNEHWTLLDFGIAKLTDSPEYQRLTATGRIMGTPRYMSPEQASGRAVDGRSDLHSVGTLLHAALTGKKPFDGLPVGQILPRLMAGDITPVVAIRPEVGRELSDVIARSMAANPDDRYPTAEALRAALAPFERDVRPIQKTVASVPPVGAYDPGRAARPVSSGAPPAAAAPIAKEPSPPKKRRWWIAALVIGALLAIGSGLGTWALLSRAEPGQASQRVDVTPVMVPPVPSEQAPLLPMIPSQPMVGPPGIQQAVTPDADPAASTADAGRAAAEVGAVPTREELQRVQRERAREAAQRREAEQQRLARQRELATCNSDCARRQMDCVRLPPAERPMCLSAVNQCRAECSRRYAQIR